MFYCLFLLDGQDPGDNRKSSIAISPWKVLPFIPSNITYNNNKGFKAGRKTTIRSNHKHLSHKYLHLNWYLLYSGHLALIFLNK